MLVERKISAKINYDVLKDLDKPTASVDSSGPTVEDVTRHAIAGITEKLSTDSILMKGVDVQTAGPSSSSNFSSLSPTMITPRTLPTRRGRLPSLQSRKRSLPSFASGTPAAVITPR